MKYIVPPGMQMWEDVGRKEGKRGGRMEEKKEEEEEKEKRVGEKERNQETTDAGRVQSGWTSERG